MSLFSPLVINCICWYVTFIPGMLFGNKYYPIKMDIFGAWLIWFFLTNILFIILEPKKKQLYLLISKKREINFPYQYGIFFLCVILSYKIWMVGSTGPENFFLNLRLANIGLDGFGSLGVITRFYPLVFVLFTFENFNKNPKNKIKIISLWCWMALFAVGTMGKFSILTPFLVWVICKSLRNEISIFKIFRILFLILLIMVFIQWIRAGNSSETIGFLKMLSIYTYSPFVGLNYINPDVLAPIGSHTFRFFYAIGHTLGLNSAPVELISEYVKVPILTNVYTVLYPFYIDFGIIGVSCFAIVYGLLFGLLYRGSIHHNSFFLTLYIIFTPYLYTQFIVEGMFSVLSSNIQFTLCLLFVFFISRQVKKND
ncbi:O-antigen polymerase [Photobacterium malacitanum]|nr:O-antigen polymerase [Photobacterium malacitanum]